VGTGARIALLFGMTTKNESFESERGFSLVES